MISKILTSALLFTTNAEVRNFKNMQSMYSYLTCGAKNACRQEMRDIIQDYGCYCMPGNSLQVRGSNHLPIDPIDEVCQTLHKAWSCIEMDGRNGLNGLDNNCHRDAIENDAYGQFKWFGEETNGQRAIICGTSNNREYSTRDSPSIACKKAACDVERAFVLAMIEADFDNIVDEQFRGMASSGACDVAPLGQGSADMCCGSYPTRFPHQQVNSYGDNRACCGTSGRAYNTGEMMECCSDGEIRMTGSC